MARQITRWSPDTCGCVVEYEWDDAVAQNARTHSIANVVQRCARHQHVAFDAAVDHFAQLVDENPRKNKLIVRLKTQFPAVFDADGNFLGSYSFDANHVLTVIIPGITSQQRTTAQTWCDTNLGVGKVVVQ